MSYNQVRWGKDEQGNKESTEFQKLHILKGQKSEKHKKKPKLSYHFETKTKRDSKTRLPLPFEKGGGSSTATQGPKGLLYTLDE